MIVPTLNVRDISAAYDRRPGYRPVFHGVTFALAAGQCLGVIGRNGAGKTTLLRVLVGLIRPCSGTVSIGGLTPREALSQIGVAYFAGEATLPGFARAAAWGVLGNGDEITTDRRRLRALSRGTRQVIGLRTVLGRQPLGLVVLDEPWEGLDPDGARWLTAAIEFKRDRGAAVVLASHRFEDLAGLCDAYLFLRPEDSLLVQAHEIAPVGPVTSERLMEAFEKRRKGAAPATAVL
jgi:ABC-2 type transport system ATP-binding protein